MPDQDEMIAALMRPNPGGPPPPLQIDPARQLLETPGAGAISALTAGHMAELPKQMFESSENLRQGGDYDPAPFVKTIGALSGGAPLIGEDASLAALGLVPAKTQLFEKLDPGSKMFDIVNDLGKVVGSADFKYSPISKRVWVNSIEGNEGPLSFGTAETRSLIDALRKEYPGAESVAGVRVSGARKKTPGRSSEQASMKLK